MTSPIIQNPVIEMPTYDPTKAAAAPTKPTPTINAVAQNEWWKPKPESNTPDTGIIGTVNEANAATTQYPIDPKTGLMSVNQANKTGYTAADWSVKPEQTVQGQASNIIAADSPLMQRAAMRADQQMNKRGLMNSSIAVGAGQAAVMDAALPIAQADAQVNAQAANFNANALNAQRQFGANSELQVNLANAQEANRAAQVESGYQQQTNLSNAAAKNAAVSESNKIRQQAATLNQDAANKLLMQDLDNQFKASISNADAASKAALQASADQTKRDLATTEATYKQLLSTNDQAGSLYGKVMQNITDIVNNPDLTADAKSAAIESQKTMLKTGLEVVSAVSQLKLGDILDFTTL